MNIFKSSLEHLMYKDRSIRPQITLLKIMILCITMFILSLLVMIIYFLFNTKIQKIVLPYNKCKPCGLLMPVPPNCSCKIHFVVPTTIYAPVTIYYRLDPFYQNYAVFFNNFDPEQLNGELESVKKPTQQCFPQIHKPNGSYILPCGYLANSIFNDSFYIKDNNNNHLIVGRNFSLGHRSIIYKNPSNFDLLKRYDKPDSWPLPIYKLDINNPTNNGVRNRHFLSWIWSSPFSCVVKPYGIIENNSITPNGNLPNGLYTLEVHYNYPSVDIFSKEIVISNEILGGTGYFLFSISLGVMSGVYLIIAIIISILIKYFPRSIQTSVCVSTSSSQRAVSNC